MAMLTLSKISTLFITSLLFTNIHDGSASGGFHGVTLRCWQITSPKRRFVRRYGSRLDLQRLLHFLPNMDCKTLQVHIR